MAKITVHLEDIFYSGGSVEEELDRAIREAVEKRIELVEIPGRGSEQLRKRISRFLEQPHIRALCHRIEKDHKIPGRIYVRFRF